MAETNMKLTPGRAADIAKSLAPVVDEIHQIIQRNAGITPLPLRDDRWTTADSLKGLLSHLGEEDGDEVSSGRILFRRVVEEFDDGSRADEIEVYYDLGNIRQEFNF